MKKINDLQQDISALEQKKRFLSQEVILQEKSFSSLKEQLASVSAVLSFAQSLLKKEVDLSKKSLKKKEVKK